MITKEMLLEQIPNVLDETNLNFLGEKYRGKVRDSYVDGDIRYLITSDRISCFDVVVTTVPFKGQVLNQMAVQWFEDTKDIVPNHILEVPDPNVMVARNCKILPIEVVVRGYITGSAWRDYEVGNTISGLTLQKGLRASEKFSEPIITPSTKAEVGEHDEPISEQEIVASGAVSKKVWDQVREVSFALFARGTELSAKRGLILVDTKYEFGLIGDELVLADEIHTLDSSRYWIADSYHQRFEAGDSPEMLDKEPTRQWLLSQGYKGEGQVPEFTDEHRVDIASRYIDSYSKVTGKEFAGTVASAHERIASNLQGHGAE